MSDVVHQVWVGRSLEDIIGGVSAFCLVLCVTGIVGSALLWTLGSALGSTYRRSLAGRLFLLSLVGTFIVGVTSGRANMELYLFLAPNGAELQAAVDVLVALGVLFALIGIAVGGFIWVVGSLLSRWERARRGQATTWWEWAQRGEATTISSVVCAVVVWNAAMVINWMFTLASLA